MQSTRALHSGLDQFSLFGRTRRADAVRKGDVSGALVVPAGVASLFSAPDYWPWIFTLIIGLPFFFVVAFSPIFLVSGWGQIYQSSVWTLTYRELKVLDVVTPAMIETK